MAWGITAWDGAREAEEWKGGHLHAGELSHSVFGALTNKMPTIPRASPSTLSITKVAGPDQQPLCILTSVLSHAGSINLDNLQSLSSDNATMAMQQAMMAAHDDSLDGTEEEDEDDMEEEEEEEEELEEEADELQTTNVSDLGLEHSDSLE